VKKEPRREHNPVQVSSEEALEKANQLAPLEERKGRLARQSQNDGGVIQVDTGDLKLPNDFTERGEGKPRLLGLEPVTIFILIFSLAFIAFIAYLISIEPANAKDEAVPAIERQP
jgi:hypothetical protein